MISKRHEEGITLKEKATLAATLFETVAKERNIILNLNKKAVKN